MFFCALKLRFTLPNGRGYDIYLCENIATDSNPSCDRWGLIFAYICEHDTKPSFQPRCMPFFWIFDGSLFSLFINKLVKKVIETDSAAMLVPNIVL